jgi:hypothetical protein
MKTADLIFAAVRAFAAVFILVLLALGSFRTDAGAALAAVVALTTATGSAHSIVHAKTCEGHGS